MAAYGGRAAIRARAPSRRFVYGAKDDPVVQSNIAVFRERLAMLGWAEGGNLRMDYRFADGDPGLVAAYAEELVNLRPDLILAFGGPPTQAVQQRTSVIPIVFTAGDPASNNLVGNIARPGGNMTGFANTFGSLGGKWLELFKEAVPGLTRVAHVVSAISLTRNQTQATIDAAATRLGVTIVRMTFHDTAEIEPAISAFAAASHGGLLVTGNVARAHEEAIKRLALHYRLPLMWSGVVVPEGVLMSYYFDQYPAKFELVVNLKTAKAIGVTIPEAFLSRADEVIE
jgi:putative ABC transport system substrate-binding protein